MKIYGWLLLCVLKYLDGQKLSKSLKLKLKNQELNPNSGMEYYIYLTHLKYAKWIRERDVYLGRAALYCAPND